uniref:Uncharacterized protein n=1 Tax=Oryza glumipatula TaxID=40148 RepID=A0A0E0AT97_9ORYZ
MVSKTGEVSAFLFQPQNSEMKDIQIDRLCKNKLDGFYCFGANLSAIVSRSSCIIIEDEHVCDSCGGEHGVRTASRVSVGHGGGAVPARAESHPRRTLST